MEGGAPVALRDNVNSNSKVTLCSVELWRGGVGRYLRCMKPCGCARVAHQWNLFQGRAPMRSCGPILHWPLHTRLRSWKPKRYRPPTRLRSCGGCEWCVTRGFLLSAYVEYTNQLCFQRITTLASLCPLHHCPFISISLSLSLSVSHPLHPHTCASPRSSIPPITLPLLQQPYDI